MSNTGSFLLRPFTCAEKVGRSLWCMSRKRVTGSILHFPPFWVAFILIKFPPWLQQLEERWSWRSGRIL